MPLVSIANELRRASTEHFAVPLFGAFDGFAVEGIVAAAEEQAAPVIIGVYGGALEHPDGRPLVEYIKERAEASPVPVSLMLDHGRSVPECLEALDCGFTDVMYDGSKLPLEGNIASTRQVIQAAREKGAGVEAELGHVGLGKDYQSFGAQREGFTGPDEAARFVDETGVDCLAIAIGTAHGLYAGDPEIDMELLATLSARLPLPLVLHGGTGCSDEQFRAAIAAGIAKVNISTDLLVQTAAKLRELGKLDTTGYFDFCKAIKASYRELSVRYLEVFGTCGKSL